MKPETVTLTLTIDKRFLRDVKQELILKHLCGEDARTASRYLGYSICKAAEENAPSLSLVYKSDDPNAHWEL